MRFAYMDEAGNTGRKLDEPEQPIHLILSLVIDEAKIAVAHEHVREVGRRHCPGDCEDAEFEFHGADLFAARGPFAQMAPARRIEIFDDLLSGIELAEADIVIRGVQKAGLERRYATPYHPHDIALMFSIDPGRAPRRYGFGLVSGLKKGPAAAGPEDVPTKGLT